MKPEKSKYLDILKVLEFAGEGGGETLYRLLPMGESRFTWRTFGNSIDEDDAGAEVWNDFSNEYEDIVEYLNDRRSLLAALYPRYIDTMFREQVFQALLAGLREQTAAEPARHLFRDRRRWGLDGPWREWQELLQLRADGHEVVIYSAIAENPITEIRLDMSTIKNVQVLLNLIYNALLQGAKPAGSYGTEWAIYDLVNCCELQLPRDDRGDALAAVGITGGGKWLVVGV